MIGDDQWYPAVGFTGSRGQSINSPDIGGTVNLSLDKWW